MFFTREKLQYLLVHIARVVVVKALVCAHLVRFLCGVDLACSPEGCDVQVALGSVAPLVRLCCGSYSPALRGRLCSCQVVDAPFKTNSRNYGMLM